MRWKGGGLGYLHDAGFAEVELLLVRTAVLAEALLLPRVGVLGALFLALCSLALLARRTAFGQHFQAVVALGHHAALDVGEDLLAGDAVVALDAGSRGKGAVALDQLVG